MPKLSPLEIMMQLPLCNDGPPPPIALTHTEFSQTKNAINTIFITNAIAIIIINISMLPLIRKWSLKINEK